MRAAIGFCVGVLGAALAACAHVESVSPGDGRANTGYQIVKSLTTEVGPRLAGTPAEEAARVWAVKTLTTLKFSRVAVEPFTFHGWRRGSASAQIVSPGRQDLVVAALGGSISTPSRGITAPIAVVASYDHLLKAEPGAFKDKIVFVNDRMMRARDGSGYGPAVRKRSKGAIEAARRGGLALLIRSAGTDDDRVAHTGKMNYDDKVRKIPAAALSAPDADQIERLHALGGPVVLRLKLSARDVPAAPSGNVVADIVGRERPGEIVLLGAHLDSWDLGTGAVDDGAGVAIVIAAALRAAGPAMSPKRTIRVVLFGAEEFGGFGGEAYAKAHAAEVKHYVAATEADFGAGRAWAYRTKVPEADLAFYDSIGGMLSSLGIERGANDRAGGTDIEPLEKLGVPVFGLVQDGTHYFDLHHTANDTLDKIDPEALEQNVEAYARAAAAIANR
ncbi:MAG: M20/M25/M40 family metallo-hydrolase [Micropepsaceae bacterium]